MSGSEQIMSVMLDAEDMRLIHQGWPEDMRLGVCLMPTGDCELLLFHQDESQVFPERMKRHFGLSASEISIHPRVAGFATHPMKYSEERALANLLTDNRALAEEAQDYSVNFSFAREEGLDPFELMTEPSKTEEFDLRLNEADSGEITFASRRAPKQLFQRKPLRNLHFDLSQEASRMLEADLQPEIKAKSKAPGKPVAPAVQLTTIDTAPSDFQLNKTSAGGLEITAKSGVGPKLTIKEPNAVFLRDDRQLLAIQLEGDVIPERVSILPHAVPSALLSGLKTEGEQVDVFAQEGYLYATRKQVVKKEKPTKRKRSLAARKRWAAARLFGLTALTILGIYLVLGSSLGTAPEGIAGSTIDWGALQKLL